jgi:hypothetical protein
MNTDTNTDQENRGIFIHPTPFARIVNTVVMKLTPLRVEDAPSMAIPEMKAVVPILEPYCDIDSPRAPAVSDEYGGYITQVISAASPVQIPV